MRKLNCEGIVSKQRDLPFGSRRKLAQDRNPNSPAVLRVEEDSF
jgi:hypothetical protein